VNLDASVRPDFWWLNPRTLAELDANVLAMNRRAEFTLEQGSRFRAYSDPHARPSLGYRVVDQLTVCEQTPPGKIIGDDQGDLLWEADWFAIFNQRVETQRYLYWLMSLPGHDNGLAFAGEAITDWWSSSATGMGRCR
jgi:hypothetical protein